MVLLLGLHTGLDAVPVAAPAQLAEPSKLVATLVLTGVGVITNEAVGVSAGGRMTPTGTRCMTTACETVPFAKPVLMGVAEILTHVPGSGELKIEGAQTPRVEPGARAGGEV